VELFLTARILRPLFLEVVSVAYFRLRFTVGLLFVVLPSLCVAQLVVDKPVQEITADFFQGQAEAVFMVSNRGDQVVKILRVQSSCDCTVAELHDRELSPQESVQVRLAFKFGNRVGEQMKTVTLVTDSKDFARVVLTLKVVIPQAITFKPAVLIWRPEEFRDPKEVLMTVSQDPRVKLVGFGKIANGLTVETHPVAKRPGLKRLRILPAHDLRAGMYKVPVKVKIDKKEAVFLLRLRFSGLPAEEPSALTLSSEDSPSNKSSSPDPGLSAKPEAGE